MNRNRLIVGLVIAVVIGLLASTYVYHVFRRVTQVAPQKTMTIVVADTPMQVGTVLSTSNVRTITWPASEPLAGSFQQVKDCTGRALITSVAANEPILDQKLAPRAAGGGLPAAIPEGMRAVSVAVNDVVGVAGFVTPGTMVDVLATGPMPGRSAGNDNNITRTILENIRVLAAGQKVEQDRQGKPEKVPVVTLLVSPEGADKLTMASTEGKIQLALRNTIDTKMANPPPVLQGGLFSIPTVPRERHVREHRKAPVHRAPYVVEVISGTKRETKAFANQ